MCLVYMPNGHDLESFLCSLAQAADYSEANCLAGEPSAMSNSTSTVSKYCSNESQTDCLTMHQSLETCENSLVTDGQKNTEDMLTLCRADSRANHSPLLGSSWARTILETCGPQLSLSSMQFDHASASLKTLQLCLIQDTSELSSEIWPKAGIVSDGEFFPQASWERRISEIGYGLLPTPTTRDWRSGAASEDTHAKNSRPLNEVVVREEKQTWPTPNASDGTGGPGHSGRQGGLNLRTAVKQQLWRTPNAHVIEPKSNVTKLTGRTPQDPQVGLADQVGGQLSPDWVEWLMNWPIHWTSLEPLPQSAVDDWLSETVNREWWQHEHNLPRVAKDIPNRTHRLKAIGNGQVSVVAALAWLILTKDLDL